ncbi:lipase family protein [Nocardia sp. CDC159]|uniref:Lipase family protein n=1 Tax=Nocardia pulmonis TaxID=2951408 RepID=A0A9X2EFK4_9NOCA|nr:MULTISPECIES: lipase family protein [Nocardia]MCM6778560.1 lipase family protein [Nocardia pulmonis]MCM6791449.1 lipase family protein [Nocardia sp. CDC159]
MRTSATTPSRWVAGIVGCLLVTVSAGIFVGPAQARTDVPIQPLPVAVLPPELDPFYKAPASDIVAAPPGGILKARQITAAFFNVLPENIDAWQVLYRTNDSHGNAIATVTTLIKPRGEAPPDGRKLLSYQIAEDSTAMYCAPSYGIQQGSIPWYSDFVNMLESNLAIVAALSKGYALSLPDYQGPNSAYGAARLGGQATLDAIRAAIDFAPLQLTAGDRTRVGLLGYSGGTIPTGWAAEHAQTYAPELNIVGVGIGGVVEADLKAVIRQNNSQISAGLIGGAFFGFAAEYPEVRHVLDTKTDWFTRFMLTTKSFLCHAPLGSVIFPFWNYLGGYTGTQPDGVLEEPAITQAIEENRLGQQRPSMPMYIYHAQNDTLIPNAATDRLVDWYCQDPGQSITYTREFLAEHIAGLLAWLPKGYDFVVDRLEGKPLPTGCNITSPFSVLSDADLADMIGEKWPTIAGLLTGQAIGQLPHTT